MVRPATTEGAGGVTRTLKSAAATVTWTLTVRVTVTPAPPFAPDALKKSVTAPAGASSAARISTGYGTPGRSGNAPGTIEMPEEPVAVTSTPPDQPFSGTSVTCAEARPPAGRLMTDGVTVSVKSGVVCAEIATLAACDGPPGVVPLNGRLTKEGAPGRSETVTVFASPGPSVKDFRSTSTPGGSAGTTVTVPEKPLSGLDVIVTGAEPPGARTSDTGTAVSV